MTNHRPLFIAILCVLALVAAACGAANDAEQTTVPTTGGTSTSTTEAASTSTTEGASTSTSESEAAVDLSGCPNPIVIQTGWVPQPERGFMYQLIGPNGEHDAEAGTYRGPALADPNVNVEIRAGGPSVGFQSGTSLLYSDPSILLFDGDFDAMIAGSLEFPVVAVMAPLEKNPQMLMYDPATYDFQSIDDVRTSGAVVLVEPNATFAKALVGLGKLDAAQIDDSYDFSPSRFVGEQGNLVQQGFATSEPFTYENDIEEWGKPAAFLLNHDAGYTSYAVAVGTKPETVSSESDCLSVLIPLLQQAMVDYIGNSATINDLLIQLSLEGNSPSPLTTGLATYAVATMTSEGIVSNGPTPALGDFDLDRVQGIIDLVKPILAEQNVNTFDPDVQASDIATNEFIDPNIGL